MRAFILSLFGCALMWGAVLPSQAQALRVYAFDPPYAVGKHGMAPHRDAHEDTRIESDGAWSVQLSEGVWRVTAELGNDEMASAPTILSEDNRRMSDPLATQKGEFKRISFTVHLRTPQLSKPPANAPGAAAVRLNDVQANARNWDGWLTLAFGGNAAVRRIEIEAVNRPTLFLVGDSLVADHRERTSAGWGQMLPALLGDGSRGCQLSQRAARR